MAGPPRKLQVQDDPRFVRIEYEFSAKMSRRNGETTYMQNLSLYFVYRCIYFGQCTRDATFFLRVRPSCLTARARWISLSRQQQGLPPAAEEAFA